jgi:hypothetical protein
METRSIKNGSLIYAFGFLLCSSLPANAEIHSGNIIETEELPQVVKIGEGPSTATFIGPNVIVAAAHSIRPFNFKALRRGDGPYFSAEFEKHPKYSGTIPKGDFAFSYDFALGILDDSANIEPNPITLTELTPSIGEITLFLGFGFPFLGQKQFGWSKTIIVNPISVVSRGFGEHPQTARQGDSGGPNLLVNADGSIEMFAVTSSGTGNSNYGGQPYTHGSARPLGSPNEETTLFVMDFIKRHNVKICGVNLKCKPVYFKR